MNRYQVVGIALTLLGGHPVGRVGNSRPVSREQPRHELGVARHDEAYLGRRYYGMLHVVSRR